MPSVDAKHPHTREARQHVRPALVVVMGVSSSGKSTVGQHLSEDLDVPFRDGDDLHSQDNIDKMSKGIPLTDDDRWGWLHRIREVAAQMTSEHAIAAFRQSHRGSYEGNELFRPTVVIACSALRKTYRDLLRGTTGQSHIDEEHAGVQTYFVYLKGSKELITERMKNRQGHFMKIGMLDSQFATLEEPTIDEDPYGGVIVIPLTNSKEDVRLKAAEAVRQHVGL